MTSRSTMTGAPGAGTNHGPGGQGKSPGGKHPQRRAIDSTRRPNKLITHVRDLRVAEFATPRTAGERCALRLSTCRPPPPAAPRPNFTIAHGRSRAGVVIAHYVPE